MKSAYLIPLVFGAACDAVSAQPAPVPSNVILECRGKKTIRSEQGREVHTRTEADANVIRIDYTNSQVTDSDGVAHKATINRTAVTYETSWSGKAMGGLMESSVSGTIDRTSGLYKYIRSTRTSDNTTVFVTVTTSNGKCNAKDRHGPGRS